MSLNYPVKSEGEKLFESDVRGIRRDLINNGSEYQASTGSGGDYILSIDGQVTSLQTMLIRFLANHSNTGAATIDVNSIGAEPIVDIRGDALVGGEIKNGAIVEIFWDGTSFRLLTPVGSGEDLVTLSEDVSKGDPLCYLTGATSVEKLRDRGLLSGFTTGDLTGSATIQGRKGICKASVDKLFSCFYNSTAGEYQMVVGTINRDTLALTAGSAVTVANAGTVKDIRCSFVSDNLVAITYIDSSNDVISRLVTISGTVPTLQTPVTIFSDGTYDAVSVDIDLLDTDKLVVAYTRLTAIGASSVLLGVSISGTSLTADTANQNTQTGIHTTGSSGKYFIAVTALSTSVVLLINSVASTQNGQARGYSFSGTVPTSTGTLAFDTGDVKGFDICKFSTTKACLAWYEDDADSSHLAVINYSGSSSPTISDQYQYDVFNGDHALCYLEDGRVAMSAYAISGYIHGIVEVLMDLSTFKITNQFTVDTSPDSISTINPGEYPAIACIMNNNDDGRLMIANLRPSSTLRSEIASEDNNVSKFAGVATEDGNETDLITVTKRRTLGGLSGLIAGESYFINSSGFTLSPSPWFAGVAKATDTIILDVNRAPYSSFKARVFITDLYNDGVMRFYHNIGFKPSIVKLRLTTNDPDETRVSNGIAKNSSNQVEQLVETDPGANGTLGITSGRIGSYATNGNALILNDITEDYVDIVFPDLSGITNVYALMEFNA